MFLSKKNSIFLFLLSTFYFLLLSILPVLAEETTELPNPLEGMTTEQIIANVIKLILGLVGVLALIMFIYGGITLMTSGGNVEAVKRGKNTLVWAVFGLAVIFFAYSLVNFILVKFIGVPQ